jgi:hypothetical protein
MADIMLAGAIQLRHEGKSTKLSNVLDKAIEIRKKLDISIRNKHSAMGRCKK